MFNLRPCILLIKILSFTDYYRVWNTRRRNREFKGWNKATKRRGESPKTGDSWNYKLYRKCSIIIFIGGQLPHGRIQNASRFNICCILCLKLYYNCNERWNLKYWKILNWYNFSRYNFRHHCRLSRASTPITGILAIIFPA